jgi:lipoprotein NlpI
VKRFVFLAAVALAAALPVLAAQTDPECGAGENKPEVTIKACTRAIEFGSLERPELAKAYYIRGGEWATLNNHDRAIADFTIAIELDPKLPGVHYSRALSHSEKGDHDWAIADYDAEVRISPKDAKAYIGRAFEWTVKGDYKRAIADYDQALRYESNRIEPWFGRGRTRFYAGDFMAAASDLVRAHQISPSMYSAIWIFLARKRADIPGEQTLAQDAGLRPESEWPAPIIGLYLGRTSPEVVQKAAATSINVVRQRDQRCEANFYIAQWHLLRGAREPAMRLLDEARDGCPSAFMEYEGAVAELRRLRQ